MKELRILGIFLGSVLVAVWLPFLLGGLALLRSRRPLGKSDDPIITGAYSYVRYPL